MENVLVSFALTLDVNWTTHVCLIYVLCPGNSLILYFPLGLVLLLLTLSIFLSTKLPL